MTLLLAKPAWRLPYLANGTLKNNGAALYSRASAAGVLRSLYCGGSIT